MSNFINTQHLVDNSSMVRQAIAKATAILEEHTNLTVVYDADSIDFAEDGGFFAVSRTWETEDFEGCTFEDAEFMISEQIEEWAQDYVPQA